MPVFFGLLSNDQSFKFSVSSFYSIGLTLHCQSNSFSSFHFISFFFTHLDLLSIASQTHFNHFIFLLLTWTYSLLPVKLIFIIFFSFIHLDLLSIASQTHFLFTWTYLWLPVFQNFIFSSGLTFDCQFLYFHSPGLTLNC